MNNRYNTTCINCGRTRKVSETVFSFIKTGIIPGRCPECAYMNKRKNTIINKIKLLVLEQLDKDLMLINL